MIEHLRGILGRGDHSWQEITARIHVFQPERRESKAACFAVIAAGLLKRTRVRIHHYNRTEDRETEREISPQRLVHYRDNWYLDAYCHLRDDLRSFSVDAIRNATLTDKKARRAGFIRYRRGHISVTDRSGLEARACECYAVVKKELDRLMADVRYRQTAQTAGESPSRYSTVSS